MFEAQLLVTNSGSYSVFSPWMARGGDGMLVTVDVAEVSGGPTLDIEVFTKNTEDTGEGENAKTTGTQKISVDTTGSASDDWVSGVADVELKELVRYKFTLTSSESAGEWILFRMLSPVWFDAVQA